MVIWGQGRGEGGLEVWRVLLLLPLFLARLHIASHTLLRPAARGCSSGLRDEIGVV